MASLDGPRRERLLVVTDNFGGGTGSHLIRLFDALDRDRWAIRVVCHGPRAISPPDHVALRDEWHARGPIGFPLTQFRQYRALRRIVAEFRPAVVHAYFFWPIMYCRALKAGKSGDFRLVESREDEGFNWGTVEYGLLRATAHRPDRVICVSEGVRRVVLAKEGLPAERVEVVRNGIAMPEHASSTGDRSRLRRDLGFSDDHLIVGMVANLNRKVKGVNYFLDAVPHVAERVPEARFLILGDGQYRSELEEQAASLGVEDLVLFAGFRPDLSALYPIMDVSALTSLSEGLSMTILESMSHALPVVATRVGGNPEIVVDGETGSLVPARAIRAFTDAVVALLGQPETRVAWGRSGRERVLTHFSMPSVAAAYQAIYEGTAPEEIR